MRAFTRLVAGTFLTGAAVLGSASAASADVVELQPENAAPQLGSDAGPYCVGFDSREENRLATVYNPLNNAVLVVVGGLYVNTVANCIG